MSFDFDDTLDFDIMHEPPTFVTPVRADDGTVRRQAGHEVHFDDNAVAQGPCEERTARTG